MSRIVRSYAASLVIIAAIASLGCHSFVRMKPDYSELPVEGLRQMALAMEQAVANGVREPSLPGGTGIEVNSDAVLQAIRTRAARSELIDAFRGTGFAVENRNGTIAIQTNREYKKATRRGDRSRNALLILSENNDRWALYEGLLEENNFPPRSLSAIQRVFFEARVQTLPAGHLYENENSELVPR